MKTTPKRFSRCERQAARQSRLGPLKCVSTIFAEIGPAVRKVAAQWKELELSEAPDFHAVTLLEPDENRLSKAIAELLDPNGKHGQRDRFLSLFLKSLRVSWNGPLNEVMVRRECCTFAIASQKRRIDILITGRDWGIGIENKPWAAEQRRQLADYAEELSNRFGKKFILIRFIGQDCEATSLDSATCKRMSNEGRFRTWRYAAEVRSWIRECRRCAHSPRVRNFIEELDRFIGAEFEDQVDLRASMEGKSLLPVLEKIARGNGEQLDSIIAIARLFPSLRQTWVTHILDSVEDRVAKKLGLQWSFSREGNPFVETDWASFQVTHKSWKGIYHIRLESQPKMNRIVLGIWRDKKHGIKRDADTHRMLQTLGYGSVTGGPCWEAFSPLSGGFKDWSSLEGTVALRDNAHELIELLVVDFCRLAHHFEKPLARRAKSFRNKED